MARKQNKNVPKPTPVIPAPEDGVAEYVEETLIIAKYVLKVKGPEAALEVLDDRFESMADQMHYFMNRRRVKKDLEDS